MSTPDAPVTPPPLPGTGRRRVVVAVVAALVVVVVAAAAVVAVLSSGGGDSRADAEDAARAFGVQMNTYDATEPDDFLDRMEPFLTPGYRADFAGLVTPLLGSLAEVEQTSDRARVDGVDLVGVDGDRAQARLDVSSRVSRFGEPAPQRVRQVWRVELQRVDGRWLVSAFAFGAGGSQALDSGPTADA
ncbi:hypothetical protein [Solicola sp. PLA-1-18]|uniref:hypothetical protein n=1 Tax=Solicola sp. PLA-1-18 TaxID=3380532 RepID=UPI003B81A680